MASASDLWGRVQGEFRSVTERTRRGAQRAVRAGALQLDLVSLRRDRHRAHAGLGERLLALWSDGRLDTMTEDLEITRLKARVESIDQSVAAKEEELRHLRARDTDAAPGH